MSAGHPPAGDDRWQRRALMLIVVGAMAVSIHGQVSAVESRMGAPAAWVFALVNDGAAMMALNAVLSAPKGSSIRVWGWMAILLAAGTGGSLNTWYITNPGTLNPETGKMVAPPLPPEFGFVVGWEPILLILVMSHLIGLVVVASRKARTTSDHQAAGGGDHQASTTRGDRQTTRPANHQPGGDHQATHVVVGARPPATNHQLPPARDHQATKALPASTTSSATTSPRQTTSPATTSPTRTPGTAPTGRPVLTAVPTRRPSWMTDDLLNRAVEAVKAGGPNYGRGQLADDLKVKDWKAKDLLKHIKDHNLARRSA